MRNLLRVQFIHERSPIRQAVQENHSFQTSYSSIPISPKQASSHFTVASEWFIYIYTNYIKLPDDPLVTTFLRDGGAARFLPAVVVSPDGPQLLAAPPYRRPVVPGRRDALTCQCQHPLHRGHRRWGPPHPGVHGHDGFPCPAPLQRLHGTPRHDCEHRMQLCNCCV